MVRSTITTKSSRPVSQPLYQHARHPSNLIPQPTVLGSRGNAALLTASPYALHHDDEQDLAFIPSADPAHPPTIDPIAQCCQLVETEEAGLDLQFLRSARRCRRGWFRWQHRGLAGAVRSE